MTLLELLDVSKSYPHAGTPAVDRLTLDVAEGSLTALLGPSGSGKSTVLKMIAGLLAPGSGDIRLEGRTILPLPPEKREIVMMFQEPLLFPYLSVADNIAFGLRMRRRPAAERIEAVRRMMALLHLDGLTSRKPAELSGGQAQRVALARALVLKPKLLLLDEPFANLDAPLRLEMQGLLQSLQRETGTAMLFVTHDQMEAVRLADRIALLMDGRLRQAGPPDVFYNRPADRAVAEFFGGRNFIEGRRQGDYFDCALGRLQLPVQAPKDGRFLTFRPENTIIDSNVPAANRVTATIEEVRFLGEKAALRLRAGNSHFEAHVSPLIAAPLAIGQTISLHLPQEALWLLP